MYGGLVGPELDAGGDKGLSCRYLVKKPLQQRIGGGRGGCGRAGGGQCGQ